MAVSSPFVALSLYADDLYLYGLRVVIKFFRSIINQTECSKKDGKLRFYFQGGGKLSPLRIFWKERM